MRDTPAAHAARLPLGRRSFLALLAVPVVTGVLHACGGDDSRTGDTAGGNTAGGDTTVRSTPDTSGGGPAGLVRSDAARVPTTRDDAAAAVAAFNAFGADLYDIVAGGSGNPQPNVVFSPTSIALALAMVRAGARGTTATEMDAVLHVADPTGIHRSANALSAVLESRTGTFDVDGEPREVTLSIANSLWAQDGLPLEQPYLDVLASEYDAGVRTTDFAADPEAAREAINAWVADETRDRIPELLGEGTITAQTLLTLVNAVYLKAAWADQFDEVNTEPLPFTRLDGTTVDTPTMWGVLDGRYAESPRSGGLRWQAADVPYVAGALWMLAVVPRGDTTLADLEAALPEGLLDTVVEQLDWTEVSLHLPKWDIETRASLSDALAALGMPTAVSGAADFTGITPDGGLSISSVIHQANITVDENGTEAAAATAIALAGAAPGPAPEPVEMHVDQAFLFALHDATGAVLFLGRVGDPSATR